MVQTIRLFGKVSVFRITFWIFSNILLSNDSIFKLSQKVATPHKLSFVFFRQFMFRMESRFTRNMTLVESIESNVWSKPNQRSCVIRLDKLHWIRALLFSWENNKGRQINKGIGNNNGSVIDSFSSKSCAQLDNLFLTHRNGRIQNIYISYTSWCSP